MLPFFPRQHFLFIYSLALKLSTSLNEIIKTIYLILKFFILFLCLTLIILLYPLKLHLRLTSFFCYLFFHIIIRMQCLNIEEILKNLSEFLKKLIFLFKVSFNCLPSQCLLTNFSCLLRRYLKVIF